MIDRQSAGLFPAKPHTVCRDGEGRLLYEEMHTRLGFDGAHSYFYHANPVTPHREVTTTKRGYPRAEPLPDGNHPLRRRLFDSGKVSEGGQLLDARVPILTNRDVTVLLARPTKTDDAYFSNGDGDELWFVQDGKARLESFCGWLDVDAGDYVFVPRGLVHRWHVVSSSVRMMGFEMAGEMKVPVQYRNPVGQLRMDAPYSHRDFVAPKGPIATPGHPLVGPTELFAKKDGRFTRYVLERPPMDVVGWEGFVYPFTFAIEKFQPKIGLVHLPPTIHGTFAAQGLLVCSFVPRVTDFHPDAIPCPYPHSSVHCDEVILYLRGNFTSRKGVGPGCISLHPAGIAHGPHPGAYEKSIGTTRTDEMAVMIDTYQPLVPTTAAAAIENPDYHASWSTH
ncbi:MAG: homogentisate 1,2-dioxygenase [Polyangiaceae bacterium]